MESLETKCLWQLIEYANDNKSGKQLFLNSAVSLFPQLYKQHTGVVA